MKNVFSVKVLCFISCILMFCACQKEKKAEDYFWIESKCANPWNTGESNTSAEVQNTVIAFLENENIEVFDIYISEEQDLIQTCEACTCTTGRRIVVSVDKKKKIEDLGFMKY
ncbi:MAG: hypothetical protein AAF487_09395 [Bacteroidota bacterium]